MLLALALPRAAGAGERDRDAAKPGLLPALAALGPGVVASGAGHFVAGDRRTAGRLFALQGIGFGLAAAGAIPLVATGASRRFSGPPIAALVAGGGVFAISWLADIYGAAGGARIGGEPRLDPPRLVADGGYVFVEDPQFSFANLVTAGATTRFGEGWRLSPAAWIATDGDFQRWRLGGGYRFFGPGSARPLGDGSYLDLDAAFTYRRFGDDDFSNYTSELFVDSRLDLERIGETLAGSFADLGAGLGLEGFHYRVAGAGTDLFDLLLVRFAFGLYLGHPGTARGEISAYYDHRRDDLAAGLSPGKKNGSGFAGHMGVAGFLDVTRRWGVSADVALGSALVARVGLRWIWGGS